MALYIFDGIPGAGKTYSSMNLRILPHLAAGGVVVTNVEVVPDGVGEWILQRTGRKWDPSRLRTLTEEQCPNFFRYLPKGTKECPVLVVLDEVHLWFNAKDWSKNDASCRQTFELATQHRKFNLDIILISQHLSNIDGQFLKLVAGLSRFRDLSKTPIVPWLPFLTIPFVRFLALHYDKTGRTLQKRDWMRFDPLVGNSYKTDAVLKGGEVMEGAETVQRVELAKDPVVAAKFKMITRTAFVFIALAVAGVVYYLMRGETVPATTVAPSAVVPPPDRAPAAAVAVPVEFPPLPWSQRPPAVPVLLVKAVTGPLDARRLLVDLDGASQWIYSGCFCTRGRVAYVRSLGGIKLHEISLWEDDGERVTLRGLLQDTLPASTGYVSYAPDGEIPDLPPSSGQPSPASGVRPYTPPAAFLPNQTTQ